MPQLLIALFFRSYGTYVLIAVCACVALFIWRILREKRSREAARGDETSLAMDTVRTHAWLVGTLRYFFVPVVFLVALAASGDFGVAFLAAVVVGGGLTYWARVIRSGYNRDFKTNVVADELAKAFDNLRYSPDETLDFDHLRDIGFFKGQDSMRGNDRIEAEYMGRHFSQCDLAVRERLTTGKASQSDRWRDVFRGRMIRFDLKQSFRGPVQVVKWDFEGARVVSSSGEWREVETEMHAFNESFKVFARDPLDAMAVLTPQMMEGVFRLDRLLRRPLALLFVDTYIYVFFPNRRDAFDVSGLGQKTLQEERELLREDIGVVTGFLEAMEYAMRDNQGLIEHLRPAEAPAATAEAVVPASMTAGDDEASQAPAFASYTVRRNLLRLWRNPTLILVAAYVASALYMLRVFPERIGVGISIQNDIVTLTQFVPTLAYLGVATLFVGASAVAIGVAGWRHNLGKVAFLLVVLAIHYLFLHYNIAAR